MAELPAPRPQFRPARHDVRVSDAERDRCAEILRDHYAAGRLSEDELELRLQRATVARTWGELRALTRDLPRRSRGARMDRVHRLALRAHAAGWASANGSALAAWGLGGADGFFWPAFILGPSTALLAGHVLAVRERLRRR